MPDRLKYHFEPGKGWINDPNGLIYFQGKYHVFFQHNPYEAKWGPMHWGHAISDDLINWTELSIALTPDMPYEDAGGCFSGSAMEKDGKLYLFYTSVSKKLGQTQSVALSEDGIHFEKYRMNPVIPHYPEDGSENFRDPKVIGAYGRYYMVCGSGKNEIGKILLFSSDNLLKWEYIGVLFQSDKYGGMLECPDLFKIDDKKIDDKYVLVFSKMGVKTYNTQFIVGDFDGEKFTAEAECTPEAGPQFYAPQTFADSQGRRIMIGWFYDWSKTPDSRAEYAGALTIPRVLKLLNGKIYDYPVEEAWNLLSDNDKDVGISDSSVWIKGRSEIRFDGKIDDVKILRDSKTIEVFINGGERSFSYWLY